MAGVFIFKTNQDVLQPKLIGVLFFFFGGDCVRVDFYFFAFVAVYFYRQVIRSLEGIFRDLQVFVFVAFFHHIAPNR